MSQFIGEPVLQIAMGKKAEGQVGESSAESVDGEIRSSGVTQRERMRAAYTVFI